MIEVIKKSEVVASVPSRWISQYGNYTDRGDKWDKSPITAALLALPKGFSAHEVNDIIGNTSWTENECSECRKDFDYLIRIGDPPDYEARWVDLCERCLQEALHVLEKTNG